MPVILFATGLFFGLLLLLNNLIKAFSHGKTARFANALLAFLTTLLLIAALIANIISDIPDPSVDQAVRWAAIGLLAASLLTLAIERFLRLDLKHSSALLAIFSAITIIAATFAIPFLSAYIKLQNIEQQTAEVTPVAASDDPEITAEAHTEGIVERLFRAIREIVANEIAGDIEETFRLLDEGVPLASLIEANGGNIGSIVERLTAILSDGLREAAARGDVGSLQAALLLSQMETLVRFAVNNDINQLVDVLNIGPAPAGTRQSFLSMLTPSPNAAQLSNTPAPVESPASTPDSHPSITPIAG